MSANAEDSAAMIQQIERLKLRKGQVSRQIGEAKRNGEPIDSLLVEMQRVSAELKSLSQALPQKNHNANDAPASAKELRIPGLFAVKQNDEAAPPANEISIHLLNSSNADHCEKWQSYVKANPRCSVYHQLGFRAVVENTLNQKAFYLLALSANNEAVGVLPAVQLDSHLFGNYVVSMPYFNYGGAVADSTEIENKLVQALWKQCEAIGVEHIELRDTRHRDGYPQKTTKVAMIRELPDTTDELWQQLGSKVRAQVKKAESHNPHVRFGKQELLDDFYRVFARNMRDLGTPVYSKAFFAALLDLQDTAITLVVCYSNKRPASCALLLGHNDCLEIPWASTLKKFNALNINMYLYWQVLSFAIDKQYPYFDFGRSSKDAGTYRFKKQWGAVPHQLYWHYQLADGASLPEINPDNPKYRLLIAVWQKLPVWLSKILGPQIVRNLP